MSTLNWQRLGLLSDRLEANCRALAMREPELAEALRTHTPTGVYMIASDESELRVGLLREGGRVDSLNYRISPAGSRHIVENLFPAGVCNEPAIVAGLDQGWLWTMIYDLKCEVAGRAGYRPPVYFVARLMEQLWIACHLHDWTRLLADGRVQLFVGEGAAGRLEAMLAESPRLAGPKVSVTLDPGVWPAGANLDALTARVNGRLHERLDIAIAAFDRIYGVAGAKRPPGQARGYVGGDVAQQIASRLRGGAKLRVMGVTSRYTTFLKHSMRDWLAAFESAGHTTRLVIEEADHEQSSSLVLAEAAAEFAPDLIVLIDHFRGSLGGLPPQVPCVMWIQDYLPHLFTPAAGAAQGPADFVIGYGRAECTRKHGYPPERFMPAIVVVNEERFSPSELTPGDVEKYGCDVSFVSHASRPAESFIAEQLERHANARPLLTDAFERLKSIYDDGLCISHPLHVRGVIQESMIATRFGMDADSLKRMTDVFTHQINNAFLRHQMLEWTADTGVDLRLYGNGWENHPRLSKFARGPADNQSDLARIYRASRISLQATPHGVVHQRTLEGLCSGGFFLMRYVPGDRIGPIYRALWNWCQREGIQSDEQILQHATPDVLRLLGEFQRTVGLDPFKLGVSLMDDMFMLADMDFMQSASEMWPGQYDRVAFDSRAALQQRLRHFLANAGEREELARSMRDRVRATMTYRAVNRRMLDLISRGLGAGEGLGIAA